MLLVLLHSTVIDHCCASAFVQTRETILTAAMSLCRFMSLVCSRGVHSIDMYVIITSMVVPVRSRAKNFGFGTGFVNAEN